MTKRKYTVSRKVLAANRRNLELARRVDGEIRFRPTPQRAAASRANLIKARAMLRAASLTPDGYPQEQFKSQNSKFKKEESENRQSTIGDRKWPDSPSYGTQLTRGHYAISLRRSARLLGETPEGFDGHVERFLEALHPGSAEERRLARGIAETVWRRLRAFRGQARWEQASLAALLREAALLRNSKLEIRNSKFEAGRLDSRLRGNDLQGHPRAGGGPEDSPRFSNFEFRVSNPPAELALDLGFEIENIFSMDDFLLDAPQKLNARLERLSRRWVELRGGKGEMFGFAAFPRARDQKLFDRPPESMGNPFQRPSRVAARLDAAARRLGEPELAPFRKLWRRRSPAAKGGAPHLVPPEALSLDSLEKLKELWEAAMRGLENRNSKFENRNSEPETARLDSHLRGNDGRGLGADAGEGHPREGGGPAAVGRVSNFEFLISKLWARLEYFRGLAEREETEVERLLERKLAGRMGEELMSRLAVLPPDQRLEAGEDGAAGALLMELVLLLNRGWGASALNEAGRRNVELNEALYQCLAARFGPDPAFEALRPRPEPETREERKRWIREADEWLAEDDSKFKIQNSKIKNESGSVKSRVSDGKGIENSNVKEDGEGNYERLRELSRKLPSIAEREMLRWRVLAWRADMAAEDDLEDLIPSVMPEDERSWADNLAAAEWSTRYFAAVGCGMIKKL